VLVVDGRPVHDWIECNLRPISTVTLKKASAASFCIASSAEDRSTGENELAELGSIQNDFYRSNMYLVGHSDPSV
jgi:hypothetical protein